MINNILLIPGSVDCNRGDQALVWSAIDLLKSLFGNQSEIRLLSDARVPAVDPSCQQTMARGYRFHRMLLENPNRILGKEEDNIHYARTSLLKVALRAGIDMLWSGAVLLLSGCPPLARRLLERDKRETYDWFRQSDLVVIKGGGFIYSYHGLKYVYYLWYVLYHILLAQRLHVPVVVLPNSFGPFETRFSRWLTRLVLRRCAFVATRESQSQRLLGTLISSRTHQFHDMAFLLKSSADWRKWAKEELRKLGVMTDGTAVGITMRPWRFPSNSNPAAAYEAYLQAMQEVIFYLRRQGLQPVLFAHARGPGRHEMDRFALEACRSRFPVEPPILVDGEYDCVQVKALYSHLGYMIGTRFHSCIFAMSVGVPTLAISYQGYKASGIMADMGLGEFHLHIDDLSPDKLITSFDFLREKKEQIRNAYKSYMAHAEKGLQDLGAMICQSLQMPEPPRDGAGLEK